MRKTASKVVCMLVASMVLGLVPSGALADVNVLHTFSAGEHPAGLLTQSDSVLYGSTAKGGDNSKGTVFKINTDGTAFSVLHSFTGTDGSWPTGSLVRSGSVLYGMAKLGGTYGMGTIFKINTDGTGFGVLYIFTGGAFSDGSNPSGSLLVSGSTLYGMTTTGGSGNGVIFKINTDGTGYGVLRSFAGGNTDGASPQEGSLIQSGNTLYGMTAGGGSGSGVIFKINTDGTGFGLLRDLTGTDGGNPSGSLLLSSSILYGVAPNGGANNGGTLFQINTDGTGFSLLRSFAINEMPQGSLIQSGSYLFGVTRFGGNGNGTIYQINTDGTGFTLLQNFTDGSPVAGLIQSGSTLYGMTCSDNENGTIYSLAVSALVTPTPTPTPTPTSTPTATPTPTPTPTPTADKVHLTINMKNWGYVNATTGNLTYILTSENNSMDFDRGTIVNLSAEPYFFNWFDEWTGELDPTFSYQTTVTMDRDRTITARFQLCTTLGIVMLLTSCLAFGFLGRSGRDL